GDGDHAGYVFEALDGRLVRRSRGDLELRALAVLLEAVERAGRAARAGECREHGRAGDADDERDHDDRPPPTAQAGTRHHPCRAHLRILPTAPGRPRGTGTVIAAGRTTRTRKAAG